MLTQKGQEETQSNTQKGLQLIRKGQILWTIAICSLVVAVAVFIFLGYYFGWKWTGFPPKKLFDWMQILVIPVAVAIGTFILNRAAKSRDDAAQQKQRKHEEAIVVRREEEADVQGYLDNISQLLTDPERPLRRSHLGHPLSIVARTRTLTVLGKVQDGERKGRALKFLNTVGLISGNRPVISLQGANLQGANLREADLRIANFQGVNLQGAYLQGAYLQRAYLQRANLQRANLDEADLRIANLQKANLQRATLQKANLQGAILDEADLREVILYGANLQEANLTGAYLQGAMLLYPTELSRANLQGADLQGANLQGANLKGAILYGAILYGAYLRGAILQKANLEGAKVTDVQLAETLSLQGATMPDGKKYEGWLKGKEGSRKDDENE